MQVTVKSPDSPTRKIFRGEFDETNMEENELNLGDELLLSRESIVMPVIN